MQPFLPIPEHLSPDYKPLPAGWKLPSWIPPFKKLLEVDETVTKRIQDSSKGKLYVPGGPPLRRFLRERAPMLSSSLGAVTALAIARVANPGINPVNLGLLCLGTYVGYKFGSRFSSITYNDAYMMIHEALKNPLFEQVNKKVTEIVTIKLAIIPGNAPNKLHSFSACRYLYKDNQLVDQMINIYEKAEFGTTFEALIFECVFLYQSDRLNALDQAAKDGKIDRENYAICVESIELDVALLTEKILSYGQKNLNWKVEEHIGMEKNLLREAKPYGKSMFEMKWLVENYITSDSPISHADHYRRQWEWLRQKPTF